MIARVFALDLRSIALFRVGLALCLLLDVVSRFIDARAFLTDLGVFPRAAFFAASSATPALWSLHVAVGSTLGQRALLVVAGLVAIALLLGYRSRAAALVSLVLLVSVQNRNLAVFYGFDLLLRASLLWACFLPLGARWSVSWSVSTAPSSTTSSTPTARASASSSVLSAGTVALTLQMFIVYFTSGLQKLQDASWRDWSAVFYAVTTDSHATDIARWLAGHVDATRALSLVVLLLELCAPFLLFIPMARDRVRIALVAAFALFHVGTALLFDLGLFPLIGIVAWLPFLPSTVWRSPPPPTTSPSLEVDRRRAPLFGAAALGAVILAFNIESVAGRAVLPSTLRFVGVALRLNQTWNMFERPMSDGWLVAAATLPDGRRVDLLRAAAALSLAKPDDVSGAFPSMRWRKYLTGLTRPMNAPHRQQLVRMLCRDSRATEVELVFVRETEHIDGSAATTTTSSLAKRSCASRRQQ